MTASPSPGSKDMSALIAQINDDHAEALLYCVRAFTTQREAERTKLLRLSSENLEVECDGQRHTIPLLPAESVEEALQATSLEAMKRLGVWPPRRTAQWEVSANEPLGQHFRRLTLHLNGDDRSDWRPGDCCRFDVAVGAMPRPYTLRRLDGEHMLVDVFCHAGSTGSHWASGLQAGRQVTVRGERHELFPDFTRGETWLLGDETALPTIAALLEHWEHPHPLRVLLSVRDEGDRAYLTDVARPPQAQVSWVDDLRAAETFAGAPAAIWAATEVKQSLTLKKALKVRFPEAEVRTIGYWRQGA